MADADGGVSPVAWASMTFAVLPGRDATPMRDVTADLPVRWSMAGAGLDRPVTDVLGISVDDGPSGLVSLAVHDYLRNSFGAVQGGVMALLGEVAAAEALGADTGIGAGSSRW